MTDNQKKDELGNQEEILTNRQGHPISDNQNTRTVGDRGPTVLENYNFLEKITHFDGERIPERVVHARGAGAHGYFEAYGKVGDEAVSKYTRAKLFQEKGKINLFVILNLVSALKQCDGHVQERMVEHFTQCDPEYGTRVREGLKQSQEKNMHDHS